MNTSPGTLVALSDGTTQPLGEVIAAGGEGSVYNLANPQLQHLVVKLYHPEPQGSRARKQQRMEHLFTLPLAKDKNFAWPQRSIFDSSRNWVGYVMHRAAGFPLEVFCHPQKIAHRAPYADRVSQARLCLALVRLFRQLHSQNILAGDINTSNILVAPASFSPTLIDCDSVQFQTPSRRFLCEVGMGGYTAPELQGKNFASTPRTLESELFAIAVLFFKVLMLGLHPYSFAARGANGLESESDNILRGDCALGIGSGLKLPRGHWYNIWSHLTFKLKSLFITCFRDGHSNPSARPTLDEWEKELNGYLYALNKGFVSAHLVPASPKVSQNDD